MQFWIDFFILIQRSVFQFNFTFINDKVSGSTPTDIHEKLQDIQGRRIKIIKTGILLFTFNFILNCVNNFGII